MRRTFIFTCFWFLGTLTACASSALETNPDLERPLTAREKNWLGSLGFRISDLGEYWAGQAGTAGAKVRTLLWLEAVRQAYPDLKLSVSYDASQNDWRLVTEDGTELYWQEGRLLPVSEIQDAQNYGRRLSYGYIVGEFDARNLKPEQQEEILARFSASNYRSSSRATPLWWNRLIYGGVEASEIDRQLVGVNFLGYTVRVHPLLVEPLARAEKAIYEQANKDPTRDRELKAFLSSLATRSGVQSFSPRTIAGSQSVSYHSFAVAIDFIPRSGEKPAYWQAVRWAGGNWLMTPPEERFRIPDFVIAELENADFFWGGKWMIWDTQHFEYRPEIFRLRELEKIWEAMLALEQNG